ncbi:unnamed protein product [Amoebophrya sp. A25]|nr:unnamed protein product [Amoebophrya sp. A25]|eukprot:GSA25T00019599001.1
MSEYEGELQPLAGEVGVRNRSEDSCTKDADTAPLLPSLSGGNYGLYVLDSKKGDVGGVAKAELASAAEDAEDCLEKDRVLPAIGQDTRGSGLWFAKLATAIASILVVLCLVRRCCSYPLDIDFSDWLWARALHGSKPNDEKVPIDTASARNRDRRLRGAVPLASTLVELHPSKTVEQLEEEIRQVDEETASLEGDYYELETIIEQNEEKASEGIAAMEESEMSEETKKLLMQAKAEEAETKVEEERFAEVEQEYQQKVDLKSKLTEEKSELEQAPTDGDDFQKAEEEAAKDQVRVREEITALQNEQKRKVDELMLEERKQQLEMSTVQKGINEEETALQQMQKAPAPQGTPQQQPRQTPRKRQLVARNPDRVKKLTDPVPPSFAEMGAVLKDLAEIIDYLKSENPRPLYRVGGPCKRLFQSIKDEKSDFRKFLRSKRGELGTCLEEKHPDANPDFAAQLIVAAEGLGDAAKTGFVEEATMWDKIHQVKNGKVDDAVAKRLYALTAQDLQEAKKTGFLDKLLEKPKDPKSNEVRENMLGKALANRVGLAEVIDCLITTP